MMKRLAKLMITLATLVAGAVAFAVEVTPQQAQTAVRNWIRRNPRPMTARFTNGNGEAQTFAKDGKALFHVVQLEGGGFVVTSGDTKINPIIAFGDSGEFVADESNPLYVLLEKDMSNRIAAITNGISGRRLLSVSSTTTPELRWTELTSVSEEEADVNAPPAPEAGLAEISDIRIAPMVKSKWNQSGTWNGNNIWNYYTPNNYVCGCTATAVAQVMRFWKAPTHNVMQYTRDCKVDNVETKKTMKGGVYDWDNMPLTKGEINSSSQCEAIGRLTYDVGVASQMNWRKDGSAAPFSTATEGLKSCFGYASADYVNENSATGNISAMPYANDVLGSLNAKMPVVLAVYFNVNGDYKNGHAIVIDGYGYYSQVMYSHINVGYSGKGDAWYNLFDETITVSYSWDTIWTCIVNIHPTVKGRVLSGRILDQAGNGVSGAAVTVVTPSRSNLSATSDSNGIWFVRTEDGDGDFNVTATKSGLSSETKKISSSAKNGNMWNVDLTLRDASLKPDLRFVSPEGWPKPVFLSNVEGAATEKSNFLVGEAIYLYNTFGNKGTSAITKDYKILHEVLDASGNVISSVAYDCTSSLWLAAGDVRGWGGVTFAIPQNLPAGRYTYCCTLDSGNAIAESDESNNVETIVFTVSATSSKPDLCFVKLDGWPKAVFLSDTEGATAEKTTFAEGDAIYLYNRFGNLGTAPITKDYSIRHEVLDSSGTVVVSGDYNCTSTLWLDVGIAKKWGGVVYPVLQNLSAGNYVYRCTLDAGNALAESDESNNIVTVNFTVTRPEKYTLTVNPNGGILVGSNFGSKEGTGQQASVEVTYGATYYWTLGTATKTGAAFDGWWTSATGGEQVYNREGKAIVGSSYWDDSYRWHYKGNVTVYAHWTEVPVDDIHTLTVNPNGGMLVGSNFGSQEGTGRQASVAVRCGARDYYELGTATREGHGFDGWWTDAVGGEQVYNANGMALTGGGYWDSNWKWQHHGDVTVYAHWEPNSYNVFYAMNGGTKGDSSPSSATFGTAIKVSAPTKPNSRFVGWTVESGLNAGTAKYGTSYSSQMNSITSASQKCQNGTSGDVYFLNLTATGDGSVTLTANWEDETGGHVPPAWEPVQKEDTMVVYAKVFDAVANADMDAAETRLGAFAANGECRGRATIMEGPYGKLFQLSVGVASVTESGIVLKVWNPQTGEVMEIQERISSNSDKRIGTIANPYVFRVGAVELAVNIKEGWNWISTCLVADDSNVGAVFAGCTFANDDVVKTSNGSATYYNGTWYPSTYKITPGIAYVVKKSTSGTETITLRGALMDDGITVKAGWNWIGMTHMSAQTVSDIRHSGGFSNDDVFKNSNASTTYYGGQWYPSTFSVNPGMGYKANLSKTGTLSFKAGGIVDSSIALPSANAEDVASNDSSTNPGWVPVVQEDTMVAYLQVRKPDGNGKFESTGSVLAAFSSSGECRGVVEVMDGPIGKVFQLSIGVASETESGFALKIWDSDSGEVYDITETLACNSDKLIGKIYDPQILTVSELAPATYTVTFNANGGTVSPSSCTVSQGAAVGDLPVPTWGGHTFNGWYTEQDGGTKISASTVVTDNVTYYAQWIEAATTCKVTLGKNGGTGGDNYVTATYGQPMPTPRTAPTLSGYTFGGYWDTLALDEKGNPKGKQYYNANMKSVRNWDKASTATLWAKWTNKVTLGKNGGTTAIGRRLAQAALSTTTRTERAHIRGTSRAASPSGRNG